MKNTSRQAYILYIIVAAPVAVWWLWQWGCSSFLRSPCTPVSEFDGEI